jgi:hypothetical protein
MIQPKQQNEEKITLVRALVDGAMVAALHRHWVIKKEEGVSVKPWLLSNCIKLIYKKA